MRGFLRKSYKKARSHSRGITKSLSGGNQHLGCTAKQQNALQRYLRRVCLMVVGLDSVQVLPQMLTSANQVREEFHKHLPFPLVLWIND